MEYESTLNVVSRSLDDVQKVFGLLTEKYSRMSAWVWRCVRSFDEMDRSYVQMEIDRIPYWTPEDPECEKFMEKAAGILGKDGFALLTFRNSVSPDYADFKVTTSGGECRSAYDQEDGRSAMQSLRNSYDDDLISIFSRSKDGYKELWNQEKQAEPPMPYKRESKPARTHEQVVRDDYLYRKSEEAVNAYRKLLADTRDLSETYEKFRGQFETLKSSKEQMDAPHSYILTNKAYFKGPLFEAVPLKSRLESADGFSFYGKIFHIHGSGIVQFKSVNIDRNMLGLISETEEVLRLAIARRGGIIDDYDYSKSKLRYTDCCVMMDNEDQRYWDWEDKFSESVRGFGLELIGRIPVWYAIVNTPELSQNELQSLQDGKLYLEKTELKNRQVAETEEQLKKEAEERARQYKAQRAKDFEDIMKMLREKYSAEKASSLAQIEKEVDLNSFSGMNYWNSVKNYISDEYGVTPAVYFKNEGIIGKKESTKTVSTLPKTEPLKKTEPGNTADTAKNAGPVNRTESAPEGQKKKSAKQKKENPLISFMRQATDAYGIELEDIMPEDDILWQLDDLPDPEPDKLTEDEKKLVRYVEKEVKELKKKFGGKPKFASYAELKKEAPEGDWKWDEDVIKKYLHTTPAAYYKEAGLIRSGSAKEQLIEQPAAKKKTAKAAKTELPAPVEAEPEKKEPAAAKAPAKKEPAKKAEPAAEKKPEKKETAAAKAPAKKEPAKKAAAPKPPKPEPEPIITEDGVLITRNPDRIECNEFSNKKELKHVIIPEGIREIDTYAFAHSGIESVVFPKSLRVIGTYAFFDCAGLKTVRLNEGLEEIREFAFVKTPALTDAYLPDSLKILVQNAFAKGYAEFTDSPTTLHMSETVARRLQDALDSNPDSWRIAAAGYVINGERYALIELYFRHKEAREWGERVAAEHARKIREREEAAERAAEKARQEVIAARAKAEQQKEATRRELRSRILNLEQERDSLRGLFAGLKRKKIQAQIDELKEQLKKI